MVSLVVRFIGADGAYGFVDLWFTDVVFFASQPVDENEGAASAEIVLEVDTGTDDPTDFEIVEESCPVGWTEYVVPADVARRWPIRKYLPPVPPRRNSCSVPGEATTLSLRRKRNVAPLHFLHLPPTVRSKSGLCALSRRATGHPTEADNPYSRARLLPATCAPSDDVRRF